MVQPDKISALGLLATSVGKAKPSPLLSDLGVGLPHYSPRFIESLPLMLRSQGNDDAPLVIGGLLILALVVGGAGIGLNHMNFDQWAGILTLTALAAVMIPMLSRIVRKDEDPGLMRLLVWGSVASVAGLLVYAFVARVVYDNAADAGVYSDGAAELVKLMKQGVFTSIPPGMESRPPETQRVALVLSFVYLVTGTSRWAGSIVFAWLSFGGRLLMWRALRRAVPEADDKRYLILLLFFPSFVYWHGTIGKEPLMMLALGVVSYGVSLLLSDKVRSGSIIIFVAGVGGLVLVRPHYGALAVLALGVGSLVGTLGAVGGGVGLRSTFVRVVALGVLMVVAVVVLSQTARFFGGSGGESGLSSALDKTLDQTTTGGSSFVAPTVRSPADLPVAVITVLFRPFVWEANNATTFLAALEGLALLILAIVGWRRLAGGVRLMLRRPYLAFVATFSGGFIVAFSYIANFGILTRQRTVMLALMMVFLATPPIARGRGLLLGRSVRSDDGDTVPVASSANGRTPLEEPDAPRDGPMRKVSS